MAISNKIGFCLGEFKVQFYCGHKQHGRFLVRSLLMSFHCGHKQLGWILSLSV